MSRFTRAFAATAIAGGLLTVLAACGSSHGTGSISPLGANHGLHYCSYTPTGSGIKISRNEHTPCVVGDTRSTKDRKKAASHTHLPVTAHTSKTSKPSSTKSSTLKKSFSKPKSSSKKH
jgi:hypothetical protein